MATSCLVFKSTNWIILIQLGAVDLRSFALVKSKRTAATQHRPLRLGLGLLRCRRHKGLCGGTQAHTFKRYHLLVEQLEILFY